jgi:cold shock CspA family protein
MAMADGREQGNIKTLLTGKQCGFIRTLDGEDFFFHQSGLEQTTLKFEQLAAGMKVTFTPIPDAPKGPRAIEVRVEQ